MKLFKFLVCVITFTVFTHVYGDEKYDAKIAVVDVESILEGSLAVSSIKNQMKVITEAMDAEVLDQEQKFKSKEEAILEQKASLAKEDFDDLVAKFGSDVSDVQKKIQAKRLAIERAHSESIETVHKKTISVIGELAKKRNFNLVLPSNQILFVANDLNITLEVITILNEKLKEVKVDYTKFMNTND